MAQLLRNAGRGSELIVCDICVSIRGRPKKCGMHSQSMSVIPGGHHNGMASRAASSLRTQIRSNCELSFLMEAQDGLPLQLPSRLDFAAFERLAHRFRVRSAIATPTKPDTAGRCRRTHRGLDGTACAGRR